MKKSKILLFVLVFFVQSIAFSQLTNIDKVKISNDNNIGYLIYVIDVNGENENNKIYFSFVKEIPIWAKKAKYISNSKPLLNGRIPFKVITDSIKKKEFMNFLKQNAIADVSYNQLRLNNTISKSYSDLFSKHHAFKDSFINPYFDIEGFVWQNNLIKGLYFAICNIEIKYFSIDYGDVGTKLMNQYPWVKTNITSCDSNIKFECNSIKFGGPKIGILVDNSLLAYPYEWKVLKSFIIYDYESIYKRSGIVSNSKIDSILKEVVVLDSNFISSYFIMNKSGFLYKVTDDFGLVKWSNYYFSLGSLHEGMPVKSWYLYNFKGQLIKYIEFFENGEYKKSVIFNNKGKVKNVDDKYSL